MARVRPPKPPCAYLMAAASAADPWKEGRAGCRQVASSRPTSHCAGGAEISTPYRKSATTLGMPWAPARASSTGRLDRAFTALCRMPVGLGSGLLAQVESDRAFILVWKGLFLERPALRTRPRNAPWANTAWQMSSASGFPDSAIGIICLRSICRPALFADWQQSCATACSSRIGATTTSYCE